MVWNLPVGTFVAKYDLEAGEWESFPVFGFDDGKNSAVSGTPHWLASIPSIYIA